MSVAKSLSEEQVTRIREWVEEGAGLSEVQRRLDADLGVKVTYMEVRFLLGDLEIDLKPEEKPKPEPEPEEPKQESVESGDQSVHADAEAGVADEGGGKVTVTISEVQRPDALVSGRVTFASGKTADWWMDQMGQLGMNATDPGFRPSEDDMRGFQQELQKVAQKKGI